MARRLIGLDVGTNAVTVAEIATGNPPRLNMFGQVALPRDAMREGEVADEGAVAEAIARLRTEVGLRRAGVRVGIASPRLIVRQVEMPVMSRDDLASALRFQAPDLIPFPVEEAAMDFAVLGTDTPEGGEPTMRVLLAAAQGATVQRLVAAVEAGGLIVDAVDLLPLALIRALGQPATAMGDHPGAEAIVSFGGGVTAIAVHEDRVPRFVRVLGTGGRELTEAIAAEVELPFDNAESLKRQLASPGDHLLTRARAAIDRPLAALIDDVRSSLDYYRNQPGAVPIVRVIITGGGSQLPGLAERLASTAGVPVEVARPRDLLTLGDIGFSEEDLPRLDPYIPGAVGLALGGAGIGTVVNLLPRGRGRVAGASSRSRAVVGAAAGAAVLIVLLAIPTLARQHQISNTKKDATKQLAQNDSLQRQINKLADARNAQLTLEQTRAEVQNVLASDVSWAKMLQELARTIPNDVWLTSFQGSVPPPTAGTGAATTTTTSTGTGGTTTTSGTPTTTAPPAAASNGTITFNAMGLDYASVSAWLQRVSTIPSFANVFVPNAALVQGDTRNTVSFSSTATITPAAHTDRLSKYEGTGK
ncbi:MAG: type pilus assembly protein PilM [Actinomycetia bacterium]|nr:type pilus assembly protein PilM [Actinomycetes bacterium]